MASREDIDYVRQSSLSKIIPFRDYLFEFPSLSGRPPVKTLISTFIAELSNPKSFFDVVEYNINEGKSLVNEGFLKITPVIYLSSFFSNEVSCAWGTGTILSDFLGKKILNPYNIKSTVIGEPRSSMQDYFGEFEYEILSK